MAPAASVLPKPRRPRAAKTQPAVQTEILEVMRVELSALAQRVASITTAQQAPTASAPAAPGDPIIVRIPAGRNFQIITSAAGSAAAVVGSETPAPNADAPFNPETFAKALAKGIAEMDQEGLAKSFELAVRSGANITRLSAAMNGIYYHMFNSRQKHSGATAGTPRRSRAKKASATTPQNTPEEQLRMDIALLRGHVRVLALGTKRVATPTAVQAAADRLQKSFKSLKPDDRHVFESFVQLTADVP